MSMKCQIELDALDFGKECAAITIRPKRIRRFAIRARIASLIVRFANLISPIELVVEDENE